MKSDCFTTRFKEKRVNRRFLPLYNRNLSSIFQFCIKYICANGFVTVACIKTHVRI